jgi:hypothetical protein
MPAPVQFVEHLRKVGYHPRSNRHGNALCALVLADLLARCPKLAEDARTGKIVYDIQRRVIVGSSEWNIDLVLGPPASGTGATRVDAIRKEAPSTIRIAIEAKTIMTKHGNARRNRQRDLDSFHQFVHRYDPGAIAAALTVVNLASRFKSPLVRKVTQHRNVRMLVDESLRLLRALPTRSAPSDPAGLECNGAIVVEHDNIKMKKTALVTTPPAPQVGDPLHYDAFLQRICDRYAQRWP